LQLPLLYFFRHGQTDWNAELRFQGQRDIPINETGRKQAAANGATLAQLIDDPAKFDFISSPLGRTRETMEIVRQCMGLPRDGYTVAPQIVEISFGDWEGHTMEEMKRTRGAEVDSRAADKWNYVPPGGENYASVRRRVTSWLETVERPSIVSCHGGVLRTLMRRFQGLSQDDASAAFVPQDKIFCLENGAGSWMD